MEEKKKKKGRKGRRRRAPFFRNHRGRSSLYSEILFLFLSLGPGRASRKGDRGRGREGKKKKGGRDLTECAELVGLKEEFLVF